MTAMVFVFRGYLSRAMSAKPDLL